MYKTLIYAMKRGLFSDMIQTYEHFKNKCWTLVRKNRNKNIISRRVHNMVNHDMVLKTRVKTNIPY